MIFSLPMAIVMANRGEGEKEEGAHENLNALLVRAQAGEKMAKDQLCVLIRRTALRFSERFRLPAADPSEDFAQEVVMAFLRQVGEIRNLPGWLLTVCYAKRAKMHQKRIRRALLASERYRERVQNSGSIPGLERFWEDSFEEKQLLRLECDRLIKHLPELQRDILILHYIDGLKYEEIAKILDKKVGTIKIHMWRAKRRLKRIIDPQSGEDVTHEPLSRRA